MSEQGGESQTFRIVGVLSPGFWFGRESSAVVDVLLPLEAPARTYLVRLRDGAPVSLAERRLTDAARAVATSLPSDWTGVHLESAHERYVGALRPVLLGITGAAVLVLLIASMNVSVLVLLRALHRQKEMSVRVALGAGRRHIVRLLAAESGLLCVVAIALVVVITRVTLRLLSPLIETQLGRPAPGGVSAIGIDSTVLLAIGGAALLIALSLSLIPLATPWRRRLAETLRSAGRHGTDGTSMRRLRSVLMGLELAGSLVLLVGCGMMVRSVLQMARTDLGFRTDGLVRVRVVVPNRAYPDQPARYAFYDRVTERAASLARARVALTSWPPFAESMAMPLVADGASDMKPTAGTMTVGPDYFLVLGTGIREGRSFTAADRAGSEPVAIISGGRSRDGCGLTRARSATAFASWRAPDHRSRRRRGGRSSASRRTSGRRTPTRSSATSTCRSIRCRRTDFGTFYLRTDMAPAAVESQLRAALAESDPMAIVRGAADVESENRQLAGTRFRR